MDPKSNAADPKLQEAYNRIMATPTQPGAAPTDAAQQQSPAGSSIFSDQQAGAAKPPPPTPTVYVQQVAQPSQGPLPSPATAAQVSDISTTLQIVYIVAAMVFFIVYTIFWIKIFNLSTPLPF